MDTMNLHRIVALGLAVALLTGTLLAEEKAALKSGPQAGEDLAGPFHPLNVTGANAGKKFCLYCSNGANPVAMIFAREPNPTLGKLLKKIDAACEKNASAKLNSFVVFCSNDGDIETKVKKCGETCGLKKVVLSIDNPAGPEGYKVNKDADVTVVLYVDRTAKANFAFKKGEMKDKDVDTIVEALPKILPSK
jgi:hypothetical protein